MDAEGRVEAYDLRKDPKEIHNRVTEAERLEYTARARAWWSANPLDTAEDIPPLDEDALKRLKSLGYLGGGR